MVQTLNNFLMVVSADYSTMASIPISSIFVFINERQRLVP